MVSAFKFLLPRTKSGIRSSCWCFSRSSDGVIHQQLRCTGPCQRSYQCSLTFCCRFTTCSIVTQFSGKPATGVTSFKIAFSSVVWWGLAEVLFSPSREDKWTFSSWTQFGGPRFTQQDHTFRWQDVFSISTERSFGRSLQCKRPQSVCVKLNVN